MIQTGDEFDTTRPTSTGGPGGEIVGESAALRRVLSQLELVAPTDSTVLINGETGTGKELVARAIHRLSRRGERTFVKLNCAAIPTGLIESELFGHERGAFTGAVAQKVGRFELAHGGTLFLDEVGEIPLEVQPKLLQVLQEQEFERLGATRTVEVDVRVVAATNRDLKQMMAERKFRSDLYFHLSVLRVAVPPLRERREDIPMLVHHFVERSARRLAKQIQTIPSEAMEALARYGWPGNVRELENLIERSVILSTGPELCVPLAELRLGWEGPGRSAALQEPALSEPARVTDPLTLVEAERAFILEALAETDWVLGGPSGTAARLGLSRTTLQARLRKLGIRRPKPPGIP